MIARLIRPDGTIAREWATDRSDLADTADRNCPAGWRVETVETAINFGYTTENAVDTRSA
jgi:hypothetical protein